MPELRAEVHVGSASVLLGAAVEDVRSVAGRDAVRLKASGLEPGEGLVLRLGGHEVSLAADVRGEVHWGDAEALHAVAGRVALELERADGALLVAEVDIEPTRLAQEQLELLIRELEALLPGLAGDLGGRARTRVQDTSPAEGTLQLLESTIGAMDEAATWVRARPLHRVVERPMAVPSDRTPGSPRDLRWLARHPASASRVRMRSREVAVRRDRFLDLDVPENRGVLGLLAHLDALADALQGILDDERDRIERLRPEREAFKTRRGSLYSEFDLPRLRALERRAERLKAVRDQVSLTRHRLALPRTVRSGPFLRTARVETHRGYWPLYRIWEDVRDTLPLRPRPALVPLRNTDLLYELWCALVMARVVAGLFGEEAMELLALPTSGWFADLPRGELLRFERGDTSVSLHYEPAYRWDEEAELGRLWPGMPLRPDLVLEVRRAGIVTELHVFDAKHRLDRARADMVPRQALDEVWLKYPDAIGNPRTRAPLVSSLWVLYPGPERPVWKRSPAMLTERWPEGRVQGGAVALRPGVEGMEGVLEGVLLGLLERAS